MGLVHRTGGSFQAMKIVVLVKQVPDSGADRRLRDADHTVDRESADNLINEMDDYAIEEGLRLREAHGGEVTILTMGPERAAESIRKALSMGPDQAVHVRDDGLAGSCAVGTSRVLAAALRTLEPDLVLCGAESTDGRVQAMPHMLAERLGVAALTGARKLTVAVGEAATLTIERQTEEGYEVVTATAPAVVSVWDTINEPRYPSFKGIMAAKKKQVSVLSLAELGIDPAEVGSAGATSAVVAHQRRPPRAAGQKHVDEGEAGTALVEFLVSEKFA
jgi:electron transfer flavoprotein beta subunit